MEVVPCSQQLPQYWGMCWFQEGTYWRGGAGMGGGTNEGCAGSMFHEGTWQGGVGGGPRRF